MGNCFGSVYDSNKATSNANLTVTTPGSSSINTSSTMDFTATSSGGKSDLSALSQRNVDDDENPKDQVPNMKEFSFADLKSATKNFRSDSLLGEGGFGQVFKGWVDETTYAPSKPQIGIPVAIKKLKTHSTQGFQEWQSEVKFLGRLSHPNLVKLLGYCWEDEELLLVYEFMHKGNLENHLFTRNPAATLSWDLRLKIAIGAARGLAFLHTSDMEVIYRDFKASNILLDGDYHAKISDFGLAKLGPSGGASHVTTRIMGTYGYAAPEYIATGHLYVKSDVYGFGVVLLEMMTGLRTLDSKRPNGQQSLVEWLKPSLPQEKAFKKMMDPKIQGQYSSKAMLLTAQLTLNCLESDPKVRPSMKEVVEALVQIEAHSIKKKTKPTRTSTNASRRSQPS